MKLQELYQRWLEESKENQEIHEELVSIAGDESAI